MKVEELRKLLEEEAGARVRAHQDMPAWEAADRRLSLALRNAAPQLLAVVEAAQREHEHQGLPPKAREQARVSCPMCVVLAALEGGDR